MGKIGDTSTLNLLQVSQLKQGSILKHLFNSVLNPLYLCLVCDKKCKIVSDSIFQFSEFPFYQGRPQEYT